MEVWNSYPLTLEHNQIKVFLIVEDHDDDNDGVADAHDSDDDGDGVLDNDDEDRDTDGDGTPDLGKVF